MTAAPQHDPGDESEYKPLPDIFPTGTDDGEMGVVAMMADYLRKLRFGIAQLTRDLAMRELSGRRLRMTLEDELRKQNTKTDAEKLAKDHPDYVRFCEATADMERARARQEAEAECARLLINARIALLTVEAL